MCAGRATRSPACTCAPPRSTGCARGSPWPQLYRRRGRCPYQVPPKGHRGRYYAPRLAPPRTRGRGAIVGGVIVFVAALIAVGFWGGGVSLRGGSPPAPPVTITGVNW